MPAKDEESLEQGGGGDRAVCKCGYVHYLPMGGTVVEQHNIGDANSYVASPSPARGGGARGGEQQQASTQLIELEIERDALKLELATLSQQVEHYYPFEAQAKESSTKCQELETKLQASQEQRVTDACRSTEEKIQMQREIDFREENVEALLKEIALANMKVLETEERSHEKEKRFKEQLAQAQSQVQKAEAQLEETQGEALSLAETNRKLKEELVTQRQQYEEETKKRSSSPRTSPPRTSGRTTPERSEEKGNRSDIDTTPTTKHYRATERSSTAPFVEEEQATATAETSLARSSPGRTSSTERSPLATPPPPQQERGGEEEDEEQTVVVYGGTALSSEEDERSYTQTSLSATGGDVSTGEEEKVAGQHGRGPKEHKKKKTKPAGDEQSSMSAIERDFSLHRRTVLEGRQRVRYPEEYVPAMLEEQKHLRRQRSTGPSGFKRESSFVREGSKKKGKSRSGTRKHTPSPTLAGTRKADSPTTATKAAVNTRSQQRVTPPRSSSEGSPTRTRRSGAAAVRSPMGPLHDESASLPVGGGLDHSSASMMSDASRPSTTASTAPHTRTPSKKAEQEPVSEQLHSVRQDRTALQSRTEELRRQLGYW